MKRIMSVILLVAMLLTGCANTSNNMKTDGAKAEDEKPKAKELSLIENRWINSSFATEEGYYYISSTAHGNDQEEMVNLMYLDYASGKEMFLCNQPGCSHDTDTCNSFLEDVHSVDTKVLFISGNRLYLLLSPADDSGSMSTGWIDPSYEGLIISGSSDTQPRLYSMNTDGTDRRVLCEFDSGIVVEDKVAVCKDSIYVICKKIQSEDMGENTTYKSAYDRQLMRIDNTTGKQEKVCDLQGDSSLVGAFGGKLVFEATIFEHELTPEEKADDSIYKKELKKANIVVSTLDVDTCQTSQLLSISGAKTFTSQMSGSKLYYSIKGENQVKCLELSNGEEKVIAANENGSIDQVYNDSMRITSWDYTQDKYYSLSIASGEIGQMSLYTNELKEPVTILAENQKQFLVVYDYQCSGEYTTWAGTKQNDIISYKLGLISKEDYFANKSSYSPVETIGDGI